MLEKVHQHPVFFTASQKLNPLPGLHWILDFIYRFQASLLLKMQVILEKLPVLYPLTEF